jgi:ATP-dependent DNA ligase
MLSKPVEDERIPRGALSYEPKWDGFRALVFRRGEQVYIQSRDLRPLDRYFPELVDALRGALPESAVVDGEIVIATERGLDFGALQLRLHPAASRVKKLASELPSSFVAFDLLAVGNDDLRMLSQRDRRARLEIELATVKPPVHVTPSTRDPAMAEDWFRRFEGAGLDGVIAKPDDAPYAPGKRVMMKIKHARTADCVVAGFRWHKQGEGTMVGSLLLGLHDEAGTLHHVGVTSSFTMQKRRELVTLLAPLREGARETHPWRAWMEAAGIDPDAMQRMPGGESRWSQGKDLSWEPLRIERVCEVKYDHLEGSRFRHGTTFVRWRDDKRAEDCRYDQLEVTPDFELARIFGRGA